MDKVVKLGAGTGFTMTGRIPAGLFGSIGAALVTNAAASREVETGKGLVNLIMLKLNKCCRETYVVVCCNV